MRAKSLLDWVGGGQRTGRAARQMAVAKCDRSPSLVRPKQNSRNLAGLIAAV